MFLSDDVMGLPTAMWRQRAALSIAGGRQSVFQTVLAAYMDALENEVCSLKCRFSRQQAPRKTPPPNDSTTKVIAELERANLPPLPPSPIPARSQAAPTKHGSRGSSTAQKYSGELRTVLRCPRDNEGAEGQGALR
ncbi:hypothetical protein JB92DRAFT_2835925 [Gautieria morchelliformis]|nr:hypothetical protein JB92DRAFT_2835925 [Gautieria morchelliformis]